MGHEYHFFIKKIIRFLKSRDEASASDPEIAGRIHPDKSPKIHPASKKKSISIPTPPSFKFPAQAGAAIGAASVQQRRNLKPHRKEWDGRMSTCCVSSLIFSWRILFSFLDSLRKDLNGGCMRTGAQGVGIDIGAATFDFWTPFGDFLTTTLQ